MIEARIKAVREGESPPDSNGTDPTKEAVLKTSSEVEKRYIESVVVQAVQWHTWDVEAGAKIRRQWYDSGLRYHFESPGQMIEAMSTFWWENRDRLPALQERLEAALAEIGRLQSALDPEVQRRQANDRVWQMAFTLAVAGHPLSPEAFFYYIQVAEATATHSPIPHPPS